MKTVLALIVAASLGISSLAFAADTVAPPAAPMATAPAAHSAPVKTMHHKKAKKNRLDEKKWIKRPLLKKHRLPKNIIRKRHTASLLRPLYQPENNST